jgi:hypothetical protein
MIRKNTNDLLDMIEKGILDPFVVLQSALQYMSDDDVGDMAYQEGFFYDDDSDCQECGSEKKWFMHTCEGSTTFEEVHGCAKCDDTCVECD